jgi:Zn-dependent peptidase ImmA (M78 family)
MVRRKHIREVVTRILKEQGVGSAPVPLKRIAKAAGVRVQKVPTRDSLSGFIYKDAASGTTVIGLNASHAEARQNFTLAHELGHFFLHNLSDVHVDKTFNVKLRGPASSEGTDVEEKEANLFAAELLMPIHLLELDLAKYLEVDFDNETDIEQLAKRYGVSTQAMTFRLAYLGYLSL